jgi:hypothetical protein
MEGRRKHSASQRGTALVKVEVGAISEISDPPLVTTDYPLLLKIKLCLQIYKNRAAREGRTRGNKRKITDYTDFTIQTETLQ